MRVIGFDTETRLIRRGLLAPKLICGTFAERDSQDVLRTHLLNAHDTVERFGWLVDDPDVILVGANTPFDLAVLCAENPDLLARVFQALDAGRIRCVQTRQKLIDIARGELKYRKVGTTVVKTTHDLKTLAKYWCNKFLDKSQHRLSFEDLEGIPVEQWPEGPSRYAIEDAIAALDVYDSQTLFVEQTDWLFPRGVLPNEAPQYQAQWALHLMSTWGVRTDAVAVASFKAELEARSAEATKKLLEYGLMRETGPKKRRKNSKDMKEIRRRVEEAFRAMGRTVPLTDSGQTATDEDTLRDTGDPGLLVLADASHDFKMLSTYIPLLEQGTTKPINARFDVLKETGRTSCSDPNWQNLSREGRDRECVVPRDGFLLASADYDSIELRALAQINLDWFGYSPLADAFNRGDEPHLLFAAALMGISIEEATRRYKEGDPVVKEQRQFAKIGNYGLGGGLGVATFVDYAKANGVIISWNKAREIKEAWMRQWAMRDYFNKINGELGMGGGLIIQHLSGRIRGEVSFTQAANGYFQGLVAELAKESVYEVSRECYLGVKRDGTPSALGGSRPIVFCHDENILEVPKDRASEAAERLAEVMVAVGKKWIKDVPVKAGPVLMSRWQKDAKAKYEDGKLVVWA